MLKTTTPDFSGLSNIQNISPDDLCPSAIIHCPSSFCHIHRYKAVSRDRQKLAELPQSKLRLVGIGNGDVFKFITPDGFGTRTVWD